MKKALLLTGLFLVLVAPMATAAGVNIAWGTECWGMATSPSNLQTFACNSNTVPTSWKMTTSFMVNADILDYANVNTVIDGVSETGAIPDWWKLSAAPDCRFVSTPVLHSAGYTGGNGCQDAFGGGAAGGGGYGYLTPTVIQINSVFAVADPGVLLTGATENFASMITIKNSKTLGVPGSTSCDGCNTGMVFGLLKVVVGSITGNPLTLDSVIPGGNQCLVWQRPFTGQPCNPPVPARNTTWGQVKSLYR